MKKDELLKRQRIRQGRGEREREKRKRFEKFKERWKRRTIKVQHTPKKPSIWKRLFITILFLIAGFERLIRGRKKRTP